MLFKNYGKANIFPDLKRRRFQLFKKQCARFKNCILYFLKVIDLRNYKRNEELKKQKTKTPFALYKCGY